jgi:hypothetical protein
MLGQPRASRNEIGVPIEEVFHACVTSMMDGAFQVPCPGFPTFQADPGDQKASPALPVVRVPT